MRYLLLSAITFIAGYIVGVIFGYRSAVVDYVENDAQTIRSIADSMYDTVEKESLPESVQNALEGAENHADGESDNDGRGFQ